MTVFVFGSHMNLRLDDDVKSELDRLIESDTHIVLGSRIGFEWSVQEYLSDKWYGNATAYFIDDETEQVMSYPDLCINGSGISRFDNDEHDALDYHLCEIADAGVAVWDGKSLGAFINMAVLVSQSKQVRLYRLDARQWIDVNGSDDLCVLAEKYEAQRTSPSEGLSLQEILDECGVSGVMASHLCSTGIGKSQLNETICQAPVSLETKIRILRGLAEKENLLQEICDEVVRSKKENADIRHIQMGISWVINNSYQKSLEDIEQAFESFSDSKPEQSLFYLFSCWYDNDVYTLKEFPVGVFAKRERMLKYIDYERNAEELSQECFLKIQLWSKAGVEYFLEYEYYLTPDGEVCWFERQKQWIEEQIAEDPRRKSEISRYSNGALPLNLSTPFVTGDIIRIDCRPFGPAFNAIVIESVRQHDSVFPNILFEAPYTDGEWRLDPLKSGRFYLDLELHSYIPLLSPLYRLRLSSKEEIAEECFLKEVKKLLTDNEGCAEKFWALWNKSDHERDWENCGVHDPDGKEKVWSLLQRAIQTNEP